MYIERFYNIIFCHCYSQNTADVKFEFYVVLKKYMKRFKYNGIFIIKVPEWLFNEKQTNKQKTKIFIILCKSFIFKSSVIS